MHYPPKPDSPCTTGSASICSTTLRESETVVDSTTSTTTRTESECETIYGCSLTDVDWTTTSNDQCALPTRRAKRGPKEVLASATAVATAEAESEPRNGAVHGAGSDNDDEDDVPYNPSLDARQDNDCAAPAVVYPADPLNVGAVETLLQEYKGKYKVIEVEAIGYVAYFDVPMLDHGTMNRLLDSVRTLNT